MVCEYFVEEVFLKEKKVGLFGKYIFVLHWYGFCGASEAKITF